MNDNIVKFETIIKIFKQSNIFNDSLTLDMLIDTTQK